MTKRPALSAPAITRRLRAARIDVHYSVAMPFGTVAVALYGAKATQRAAALLRQAGFQVSTESMKLDCLEVSLTPDQPQP